MWTKKIFESYFSDRLTFSNIHGRTSRQIYTLAVSLRTPETLSSSSKSRIFLYNAHLPLFVRRMAQLRSHKPIGKAMTIKLIVSQAFFLGKPMRDAAFYFILQATPTISWRPKNPQPTSIPYKTTGMKDQAI